jgi:hypothetical protein
MSYLLLIMEDRDRRRNRPAGAGRREYERMARFGEDLKARGVYRTSESLRSLSEGARISVRGGKRVVADGPFAESKEMVGGFFLLECRTREEAIATACECPAAEWATIEVREIGPCYDEG